MFRSLRLWLGLLSRCFRSHRGVLLENLALRQQWIVFKRKRAKPRLSFLDKLFWVLARRFWPAWKRSLIVVTPENVARWHRAVLEPDLEGEKAGWQKKDLERGQGLDLSRGSGES